MSAPISLQLRPSEAATCSYCLDQVTDPIRHCLGCHTNLHEDCFQELGRCPSLGCEASHHWSSQALMLATTKTEQHRLERPAITSSPYESLKQSIHLLSYVIALPLSFLVILGTITSSLVFIIKLNEALDTSTNITTWLAFLLWLRLNLILIASSRQLIRWTDSLSEQPGTLAQRALQHHDPGSLSLNPNDLNALAFLWMFDSRPQYHSSHIRNRGN